MKTFDKIVKNSLSNSVAFAVEAITAFLLMPFVINHLGDSAYGIWVLINALTGYLGLFKLGFRPSINKHVAEYEAKKDFDGMREYMGATLHIYIYLAIAIMLTSIIVSYFLPDLFVESSEYTLVFQVLILFAGIQSVFSLLGTAYGGVISGYQRYEINAGIEIVVILVRAILIFVFLPYFNDLYTVAIAHFSITIIGFIATMIYARHISPVRDLPVISRPSKSILQVIIKYNSVSFTIAALAIFMNYMDSVIVGLILPLSVITHYVIGTRLIKYATMFLNVTTKVIAPAISELNAKNNKEMLNTVLVSTYKASCVVIFPMLFYLIIQGDDFIELWVGPGYSDSYMVMVIFAISGFLVSPTESLNSFLYGMGTHVYLMYINIAEVIIVLPLCYISGVYFGLIGVAIGIAVPRAILRGMVFPLLISNKYQFNLTLSFVKSQFIVFLGSIPFIVYLVLTYRVIGDIDSWLKFVLHLFVGVLIYILSIYIITLDKHEKNMFSDLFGRALKKS